MSDDTTTTHEDLTSDAAAAPPGTGTDTGGGADPGRSRAEDRISELARERDQLRDLLNRSQQLQADTVAQFRHAQANSQAGLPVVPEYDQHPYTQYMGAKLRQVLTPYEQALIAARNENDALKARLAIDDDYGPGTYRTLAAEVEQEAQQEAARGNIPDRHRLFFLLAGRKGMTLTPAEQRAQQDTDAQRRRARPSATVESGAPARRATDKPQKSLKDMSLEELEAQAQREFPQGF